MKGPKYQPQVQGMNNSMKKLSYVLALALVIPLVAVVYQGCGRAEAKGKLQIMYSGNIRGNVSPCG
jgi:ABC-type tungstate transport system substrate-binding protein